jgi:hypothetical protein
LGCGNGGLNWSEVAPRIEGAFAAIPGLRVLLYPPAGAPPAEAMPNRTEAPKMTLGRAALVALIDRYFKGLLDPFVSLLEVHKLMYFLKAAGEPIEKLTFQANRYGPYAPNIRHSLIKMENHLTRGYGEGRDDPTIQLELLPGAVENADEFLRDQVETKERMEMVAKLIEGYEDPYGMELLSSVHWVMQHNERAREDVEAAITAVHDWNERKRRVLKPEHLRKAWARLKEQRWDSSALVA